MKRVRIITYIIIAYVAAFVIWWMILLGRLETKQFELQKELLSYQEGANNQQIEELKQNHDQNKNQFIYEGVVFLLLLAGSSYFVIKGIQRAQKRNQVNKNFLLATTHEFKTPLATTKLNLQTLLKENIPEDIQLKLIDNSVIEINRLNQLIDNILLASKLDTPNYSFELVETNISHLLEAVVDGHPSRDRMSSDIEKNLNSKTDSASLKIIIHNLIDNAIKYGEDGPVHLVANKKGKLIEISVIDEGIGIPAKEKRYIFDRFYRIEQEETRSTKGTGLGLYLVKEMMSLLKGGIEVKENKPKGSIFTIRLPLKHG